VSDLSEGLFLTYYYFFLAGFFFAGAFLAGAFFFAFDVAFFFAAGIASLLRKRCRFLTKCLLSPQVQSLSPQPLTTI
jgi:hypothetical protein